MAPWGGTALYDVIIKAIDMLGRQPGRRSIVLFSDGDDQIEPRAARRSPSAKAEGSDATIYAIGQGRAVRSAESAEADEAARRRQRRPRVLHR